MQNNVIALCLALFLRLLRDGLKQLAGVFVFQRMYAGRFHPGSLPLSVDLDSGRLDAVSRSLWWGPGMPVPEPARTAASPPVPAARPLRWYGSGPEIFLHHDA